MDVHDLISCLLLLIISTTTASTIPSDLTEESSTTISIEEYKKKPCTIATGHQGRELEFYCPSLDLINFTVKIKFGEAIQTICNAEDVNLTSVNVNVGPVNTFSSKNCNLVNTFRQLFKLWNIKHTKTWDISGYSDKDFVLRKSEFEDLDVSEMEVIRIQRSNIIEIEVDTFYEFVNLKMVSLIKNKLKALPDLFKYSKSVLLMEFAENDLETLPEQLTAPSLKNLALFNNNLKNISESLLSNAPKLEIVEFSKNNIEFLPEKLLYSVPYLKMISFLGNNIAEIPPNFFKNNKYIFKLHLSTMNLSSIPENLFESLTNLSVLTLDFNNLESLPEKLFSNQTKLKELRVNDNKLTHLQKNGFKDLTNLEFLDLANNKLTEWTYDLSSNLKKLKHLNLSGNNLNKIVSNYFYGLSNLKTLKLTNNNISDIAIDAFSSMDLNSLDLSRNNLKDADLYSFIDGLKKVGSLNLDYNFYETVPSTIQLKTDDLSMSHNNIKEINMLDLTNVKNVRLNDNKIETILFDWLLISDNFDNLIDTSVDIENNPIQCGCSAYSMIEFFNKAYKYKEFSKHINLKGELKCQGPPKLAGKNVRELQSDLFTCDYTQFYHCPEGCSCEMSPKNESFNVDCSGLNLKAPPSLPEFLPIRFGMEAFFIKKLLVDISNNSISNFTERDISYSNVSKLSLANNKLDLVSWLPPRLEVLELNDNHLQNLDYNVISILNKTDVLERLTLHDNDWLCNCQLLNLTKLVTQWKRHQIPSQNENNIMCSNGERVVQMTEGVLCALANQAALLAIGACFFLFLVMICVALILYYKYEYHVKVWLYSQPLFMRFVTEDDLDKDKIYDAFVSYAHEDENFVANDLISMLEKGPGPYKLCIHTRDWIVGEFISKQIVDSVENSRRTIIVLSPHFLKSEWATLEFRTAHVQAMKEGRHRLVVILYGDIDPSSIEDEDLKTYLSTNTYVKWGDPWFWKKLWYVLPHKRNEYLNNNKETKSRKTKNSRKMENIMVTIDKMDLINSPATPNLGTPPAVSLDPLLIKSNVLEFKSAANNETPPAEGELITTVNHC